jgi:hypothetical protein
MGMGVSPVRGVDSFVGEFIGDGITLKFDFGDYSNPLKEEKKPAYVVVHKSIGGFRAKVVSPRTPVMASRAFISAMLVTGLGFVFGERTLHPSNRNWL